MTTLRNALKMPLPDAHLEFDDNGPDATPRYTVNENFAHTLRMIQELQRWSCLVLAHNAYHTSDSELDSVNALVLTIENTHKIIYGNDQTMDFQSALDDWLDEDDGWLDLQMASDPNFATPADLPTPEIFSYFILDYDAFDDEDI